MMLLDSVSSLQLKHAEGEFKKSMALRFSDCAPVDIAPEERIDMLSEALESVLSQQDEMESRYRSLLAAYDERGVLLTVLSRRGDV